MRRSVILGVFTLVALVMTCVTPDFQLTDNHEVSAASSLLLAGNVYAADKPADPAEGKSGG